MCQYWHTEISATWLVVLSEIKFATYIKIIPFSANILNQHFCFQVQKPNPNLFNEKRDGLAPTGENSSSAHVGTQCSNMRLWISLSTSGLLSTVMALFLSGGLFLKVRDGNLHFRFMIYLLNKLAEGEL